MKLSCFTLLALGKLAWSETLGMDVELSAEALASMEDTCAGQDEGECGLSLRQLRGKLASQQAEVAASSAPDGEEGQLEAAPDGEEGQLEAAEEPGYRPSSRRRSAPDSRRRSAPDSRRRSAPGRRRPGPSPGPRLSGSVVRKLGGDLGGIGQDLGRITELHKEGAKPSQYLGPAAHAFTNVGGLLMTIAPFTLEAAPVVEGIGVALDMTGRLMTGFLGGEQEQKEADQPSPEEQMLMNVSVKLDQLGVQLSNVSHQLEGMQRQMDDMMRDLKTEIDLQVLDLCQPFTTFYKQIQTVYDRSLSLVKHEQPDVLRELTAETWLHHTQDVFRFQVAEVQQFLQYLGANKLQLSAFSGQLKARAALALQQVMLARSDWFFISTAFYNLDKKRDALWLAPDLASDMQDYVNLAKGAGMFDFLKAQPSRLREIQLHGSCGDIACPRYTELLPNASVRPGNSKASCCLLAPSCQTSRTLTSPGLYRLDLGKAKQGGDLIGCSNNVGSPTLVFSGSKTGNQVFSVSLVDAQLNPVPYSGGHAMTVISGTPCSVYSDTSLHWNTCGGSKITLRNSNVHAVSPVVAMGPELDGKYLVYNVEDCPNALYVSRTGKGMDGIYYRTVDTSTGVLFRTRASNSRFDGLQWRSSDRKWVLYNCKVSDTHHCSRIMGSLSSFGNCPYLGSTTFAWWVCQWKVFGKCMKQKEVKATVRVSGNCWSSAPSWLCARHPGYSVCCSM